jgi:S1-C subfamily serine protease
MKRVVMPLFLGLCAFLGGLAAVAVTSRGLPLAHAQPAPLPRTPVTASEEGRLGERFEYVASKVSSTVVAIEATKPAKATGKNRSVDESGSGVLIRIPGQTGVFVLTNNHVIQQAAPEQITISLADNRIVRPIRVWADPESDVAALKLDERESLPTAALGNSDSVRVGQWVLAIGSPFGLNQTVTHGIISARERGQVSLGNTIRIKDFLQTDAAINPGSSGGPLINLDGEVIGINTAIASNPASGTNTGIAFSIPVNLIKRVLAQLLEKGSVSRGYLGLQVAGSFEAADAIRLGLTRAQGALVDVVYPDTPAAQAGLRVKDVLLMVDGVPIRNGDHIINIISSLPAGRRIQLQLWREGRAMNLPAVIGDWSTAQARFKTSR